MGARSEEGINLSNLGLLYGRLGQYAQALEYHQQALIIAREVGARSEEGINLSNLGIVYINLGQYAQALEFFQQALSIQQEIGNHSAKSLTLNGLGEIYLNLGQYEQALDYYQQALSIQQETDNRAGEGMTLNSLGSVYGKLGEYAQALEFYQQALSIVRETGNRAGEGTILSNLGSVYDRLGEYAQALEFYQQALSIVRETGNRSGEGTTLNGLGSVYGKLGEYVQALEFYQQALAIRRELGNRYGEGTTLNNLGALYFRLGQYAEAERYYFDTMVVWESLRSPELSDEDKIAILDTQTFCYQCLQRTLIAQNKIETALEISERGRARAFVELMAQRLHGDSSEEFVPPAPPTLADIQQVAREQNATLVEYAVLDDEFLYIWVISPDGNIAFRSVNLAETTEEVALQELVDNTRFSMGVRDRSAIEIVLREGNPVTATSRLQQLHQLLIEPISDLLPKPLKNGSSSFPTANCSWFPSPPCKMPAVRNSSTNTPF